MYLFKTPTFIPWVYPHWEWKKRVKSSQIFLTFDDGPIPEVSEFVLDTLREFQAKASFFCVGDNIRKHPEILQKILEEGHHIGNHTYHHRNGRHLSKEEYWEEVRLCQEQIERFVGPEYPKLFRPPYGRLKASQSRQVRQDYRIIMWDVLTYDFDSRVSPETALAKALQNTQRGSIVLFHDSLKAENTLRYALPRFMEHFAEQGYQFTSL